MAAFGDIQNRLLHDLSWAPLRYGAIAVIVLTLLWLPLGIIGFAGWLWLCRLCLMPESQAAAYASSPENTADYVYAPLTGRVMAVSYDPASKMSRLFCQMDWDASHLILMPVSGEITENLRIDGAFQPLPESVYEDATSLPINARRDIQIRQDDGQMVEMIFWGLPHCRYLASNLTEGQSYHAGAVAGLTLLHGIVELRLPDTAKLRIEAGATLRAGTSLLASFND